MLFATQFNPPVNHSRRCARRRDPLSWCCTHSGPQRPIGRQGRSARCGGHTAHGGTHDVAGRAARIPSRSSSSPTTPAVGPGSTRASRGRDRRGPVVDAPPGPAHAPPAPPVAAPNPLSRREREVLGMLARGLRNKEIAELLFIADRTVKFHAQAIYRKLAVANRTEAVSVALRRGIVALDAPVPGARDAA